MSESNKVLELLKTQIETVEKTPVPTSRAIMATRTFVPPSRSDLAKQYASDKDLRERALRSCIPFIHDHFSDNYRLTQGLTLVGGVSGQGKSTTTANVLSAFLNTSNDKKALVITNEESAEAVFNRVACVLTKKNFFALHRGKMNAADRREVEDMANLLFDRIVVVYEGGWDMTCLEDVQSVLEHVATGGYGIAVIDYLQTVAFSKERPDMEPFQVSKTLGLYLKDYGRRVPMPVVVFAQLKTRSENGEFKDRIENDKTIYNHAFSCIEIIPDFETGITKFIIHKDRFGMGQGEKIDMQYVDGRYEPVGHI